jgi:arylformamidase
MPTMRAQAASSPAEPRAPRRAPRPWLHDAATLERGYNNRALVPDHGRYLERWARDSAALRAACPAMAADLPYGDTEAERLDLFSPSLSPAGPAERLQPRVLMFIHGGWFRALDKSDHSFVAAPFIARGVHVVVPNYALCPAVTVETIVLQMVRAVAYTWRAFQRAGRAAPRLVLAGHSAGGHLAAMLACCDWRAVDPALPARPVAAAVAISGVFELESLRRTPFLQADLRLDEQGAARLSPAWMPAPDGVPVEAWVGADESALFHEQAWLLRRRWGRQAVPRVASMAARHHFSALDALAEPGSPLFESVMRRLGPTNAGATAVS